MTHFQTLLPRLALSMTAVLGLLACRNAPAPMPQPSEGAMQFSIARIFLEQNLTDQDAEVVMLAKGQDEGLESLSVFGEDGAKILQLSSRTSTLGVREFAVESPEPGMSAILAAYPEGTYRFVGVTFNGVRLQSTARLSHDLPEPADPRIDPVRGTIEWNAVAGAAGYSLELEREVNGEDERTLTVELPPDVTSFRIPDAFRVPDDYQAGVAVISRNGNITIVEKSFSVEK